jgi:hypothetical protein
MDMLIIIRRNMDIVYMGGGGGNIKIIHYSGQNKPWMKNNSILQRIRKILSNIKHFDRYINYRQSVLYEIDEYYKKIDDEIDMM